MIARVALTVLFALGLSSVVTSEEPLIQPTERLRAPGFDDASRFDAAAIAHIDDWLQAQLALAQFPSLSVAVVRDGAVAYQGTFGYEDLASRRRATPDTSYHVASVTKVFTTTMLAQLHAGGVVDMDQPAVKYLPKGVSLTTNPERGRTITLRQLASHTSGLPRGVPGPVQSAEGRYQLEPERLYRHLAQVELAADPGAEERYSNLGMGLLGHVMECAAGKPFDQLLQEVVCDPLGLERTAIQANDRLRLSTGYPHIPASAGRVIDPSSRCRARGPRWSRWTASPPTVSWRSPVEGTANAHKSDLPKTW